MTRDAAGAVAWARANPKRITNGPSWDGACAALIYNAGGFPSYYGSAIAAYAAAAKIGPLNRDASQARPGDIHYWNNVIIGGQEYGHVAEEVSGGGRSVLMASNAVTENFGHESGLVSVATYKARKPWVNYLGFAPRFGQWASVITAPAGGTVTPIGRDDDVPNLPKIYPVTEALDSTGQKNGSRIWYENAGGLVRYVENTEDVQILVRHIALEESLARGNAARERMYSAQVDRIIYYNSPLVPQTGPAPTFTADQVKALAGQMTGPISSGVLDTLAARLAS